MMERPPAIPRYYLYGDPARDVELDFLHVEPILDRSGPNDWTIRPHFHPDHSQVMFVAQGGGEVRLEESVYELFAPTFIVIPAGVVHEIRFEENTEGYVLTAALAGLRAAAREDAALIQAATTAGVLPLRHSGLDPAGVAMVLKDMMQEFVWQAPGRRAALLAQCTRLLVFVLRAGDAAEAPPPDRDLDLLNRYRGLIESHFRHERAPSFYAQALAVTPARLNAACRARGETTASELLYQRILIEAKRHLAYTDHTVSEVAHIAGFDDPAYFSRFFSRHLGLSPAAYRQSVRTVAD
ncbi:AraC family transcriptional regulator [Haematobacter massiliensis]|uniref:AraC family transcriptional regulator n=2 Tax=Haematobacter massiliensis TaxID=195105 RepID=A0A086Y305_9RHOB|nr:helix-turn-helix domain-containing protein [Haematobacter massiliensis]KFI28655.1 AraC family transcriptional regulator [Haematobacter massiliensis]